MIVRADVESRLKGKGLETANKGLRTIEGSQKRVRSGFQNVTGSMLKMATAGVGLYSALRLISSSLEAQARQEGAINKLNLALANQGRFSKAASAELQNQAAALQKVTRYGDEATIEVQGLLASYGMGIEEIKQATAATLDFATVTGNTEAAAKLLGKAFVGETGELSRYGIIIDKNIPKSEKFAAVLDQLRTRFGGMAQADVATFSGALEQLQNTLGDTQEAFGKFIGFLTSDGEGAFGGFTSVLERISKFFGSDLILALSEARAQFSEFLAWWIEGFADMAESLNKLPAVNIDVAAMRLRAEDQRAFAATQREQGNLAATNAAGGLSFTNAAGGGGGGGAREAAAAVKTVEMGWRDVADAIDLNVKYTDRMIDSYDWLAGAQQRANQQQIESLAGEMAALGGIEVAYDAIGGAMRVAEEELDAVTEKTFDWRGALEDVSNQFASMGGVLGNIGSFVADMTRQITGMGAAWKNVMSARATGKGGLGGLLQMVPGIGGLVGGAIGIFGGIKSLFGGKSDEEKAAERAAEEQRRQAFEDLTGEIRDQYGSLAQAADMAERYGVNLKQALDTKDAEQLSAALDEIQNRQAGLAQARQGILDFPWADPELAGAAAGAFSSVFWATVKTDGIVAATDAMRPAWEQMQKTFAEAGLDRTALGGIGRLFKLAADPAFAAASQAASGLGQVIGGMTQAGMVDQRLLTSGGATAEQALAKAIEAGASPKEAFQLISPLLTELVNASTASGQQLDANTQALLDEARANGIDILADPVYQQLDELRAIRKAVERTPGSARPDYSAATGWGPRRLDRDTMFLAHAGEHVMVVPKGQPFGFKSAARGYYEEDNYIASRLEQGLPRPTVPTSTSGGGAAQATAAAAQATQAARAAVAAVEKLASQPRTVEVTSAPQVTINTSSLVESLESRRYLEERVADTTVRAVEQNVRGMKVRLRAALGVS